MLSLLDEGQRAAVDAVLRERRRAGRFRPVFPTHTAHLYRRYFETQRPLNELLTDVFFRLGGDGTAPTPSPVVQGDGPSAPPSARAASGSGMAAVRSARRAQSALGATSAAAHRQDLWQRLQVEQRRHQKALRKPSGRAATAASRGRG